jgi:hypothetical protein
VEFFAAHPPGHDQSGFFEYPQVLHDTEARHAMPLLESAQRLAVLLKQRVQELAARRIGERPEDSVISGPHIAFDNM